MTTRTACTEVSDRISAFPVSLVPGAAAAMRLVAVPDGASGATRPIDVQSLFIESLLMLDRRAAGGDPACLAARSLMPSSARIRIAEVAGDLARRADDAGRSGAAIWEGSAALSGICYALAVDADLDGRPDDAMLMLAVLVGAGWGELDGCLGLAVLAARMERFADALVLAGFCMDSGVRHPRILSVIGICLLEEGDSGAAQAHLAAAARLARTHPAFREDLQAAQRALLMMHLA